LNNKLLIDKALPYFPGKPTRIQKINRPYKCPINQRTIQEIQMFIKDSMDSISEVGLNEAVVGLSGGIDSGTVALLCRTAIGLERTTAVIVDLGLPAHDEQRNFAERVARDMNINYVVVQAGDLLKEYNEVFPQNGPFSEMNIITRIIHNVVFQVADSRNAAVISCLDLSENLLARHMEYFYGHISPLGNYYKTEVYDIAGEIGVPAQIFDKKPGCVEGWLDHEVFGVGYDILDPILYLLTVEKIKPEDIATEYDIDIEWLEKIYFRIIKHHSRMHAITYRPPSR